MKNKGLEALQPLVGEWEYTLYNAWFLESMDTRVTGKVTIEWIHDAFICVRGEVDSSMNKPKVLKRPETGITVGIIAGILLGVVLGMLLDNPVMGMGIGIALGVAVGAGVSKSGAEKKTK